MDIGILRKKEIRAVLPYPHGDGGEAVELAYMRPERNRQLVDEATELMPDEKGRMVRRLNTKKYKLLVAKETVKALHGFTDGGEPVACDEATLELMLDDYRFGEFIDTACIDLQRFRQAEKAEAEKNSEGTSGQG